jgi:hypothetical protein
LVPGIDIPPSCRRPCPPFDFFGFSSKAKTELFVTRALGSLLCLFLPLTALADEHGARLGKVLAAYADEASIEARLAEKKAPADFSDEEMRGVLAILENRLGADALKEHVRAKPGAFRHLRLRRLQAYFSLLEVFLEAPQIDEVLRADFAVLRADDFTEFLTHSALLEAYERKALPRRLRRTETQQRILKRLAKAIDEEGYPLPSGRAREVVATVVADVDDVLASRSGAERPAQESAAEPAAGPSRDELRALVLRLRAVGTDPDERREIAARLVDELPELLRRRLREDFEGSLSYEEHEALQRCLLELLRGGPNT